VRIFFFPSPGVDDRSNGALVLSLAFRGSLRVAAVPFVRQTRARRRRRRGQAWAEASRSSVTASDGDGGVSGNEFPVVVVVVVAE